MLFDAVLREKVGALLAACKQRNMTVATAESCTGGLLSALLTEEPGSSAMFTHGFITYANEAKAGMLGVPAALIETHGAVSAAVARAMAEGALQASGASLAVSITGIAGPGGGSDEKPVGTVHVAVAMSGRPTMHQHHVFSGDRSEIRLAAVENALDRMLSALAG